jgi:hypothetical protein
MPSSRVRQNASCTWIPFVQTVSSPSYTLSSCRRPRDGVPVPGVLCSSFTSTPPCAVGLGTVFSFSTVLPCARCTWLATQVNQMCEPSRC